MRHLKVLWVHGDADQPHILYYEADAEDNELREMETFPDGSFGLVLNDFEFGKSIQSEGPLPDIADIRKEPDVYPFKITAEEFERVWNVLTEPMNFEAC